MSSYEPMPAATGGMPARGQTRSNGFAVAGLVCGVVGLLLFNIVLGPLAIIFGSVGLSRARNGAEHRTMSVWSIILGIVDIALFVVVLALARTHGGIYFH